MDDRLERLLDEASVRRVICKYCFACDRLDLEMLLSIYAEDSWDDHGDRKMNGQEFARSVIASLSSKSLSCSHQLGQSLINISGNVAKSETYFVATVKSLDPNGSFVLDQMGGRYVDKLVKTNSDWKISHRTCVKDWAKSHSQDGDWLDSKDFVEGQRNVSDVAYGIFNFSE